MASLSPYSAAPQLISISRPSGSACCRFLAGSAYSSMESPRNRNCHGWLLCSDGALAAVAAR